MNIYLATYKFKDGGEYVPEDPVAGGGFYRDRYVENFVVAQTAAAVRRAVKNDQTGRTHMIAYHELTAIWRAAGGRFHGPRIETGTMPEAALLPLLQALVGPDQTLAQVQARVAALPKYVEPQ